MESLSTASWVEEDFFLTNNTYTTNMTLESCQNFTAPFKWDTYKIYRVVIEVFIVGFLCLIGFVGNALSIVILYRDNTKKNTTNWLLQTLAVVDSSYLFTCIFIQTIYGLQKYTPWFPDLDYTFPYIYPYVWVLASIAQTITVWMVLLVTIDRYVAICQPLKTQLRSIERARLAVVVIVIAGVLYNIPRFFERKMTLIKDCTTGQLYPTAAKAEIWEHKTYFLIYKTIMYFIFRSIGPLLVLIILNLRLIQTLHFIRIKHKHLTSKSNKNKENITLMLVAVVSVFIVCELPDSSLRVVMMLHQYGVYQGNLHVLRYANTISNMLLTVNSSINFLIYCLIGKKFRTILHKMCCPAVAGVTTCEASETEPLTMKTTYNMAGNTAKNGIASQTDKNEDVPL